MKNARKFLALFLLLAMVVLAISGCGEKKKMENQEVAVFGQKCTVTIEVKTVHGYVQRGSGFFIDGKGTLATAFHVIEGASEISVIASEGGSYPLEYVVAFNPVYDIAILKINYESKNYLTYAEEAAKVGDPVVAVGSALGSLGGTCTFGYVSSEKRMVGNIECIQIDAAISSGNSGGPLLNSYGEVIGINCISYTGGQNLNLAVKTSMLSNIGEERNYNINKMREWYNTETSRSYSPYASNGKFYYSLVNTYETVTGVQCRYSYDNNGTQKSGYNDTMYTYEYAYDIASYDKYTEYLEARGFVYEDTVTEDGEDTNVFVNEKDGYMIKLGVVKSDNILNISIQNLSASGFEKEPVNSGDSSNGGSSNGGSSNGGSSNGGSSNGGSSNGGSSNGGSSNGGSSNGGSSNDVDSPGVPPQEVTLPDAQVTNEFTRACTYCNGEGEIKTKCSDCNGKGEIIQSGADPNDTDVYIDCTSCVKGYIIRPCEHCNGASSKSNDKSEGIFADNGNDPIVGPSN